MSLMRFPWGFTLRSRHVSHRQAIFTLSLSIVVAIVSLAPIGLRAQQEMKWGEVPRADLEMSSFEADTNATALILGDMGEVEFRDDFVLSFRRHRRIKILMMIRNAWIPPEDYQALREFYGRIVSAHAEQIVLKRSSS